jgi:hypothetical protein
LKERIVEPEKKAITREQLGKHPSEAISVQATIEELLEVVFSMRSLRRLCTGALSRRASSSPFSKSNRVLQTD